MRPAAPAEVVRLDAALARQAAPRAVASHSSTASAKNGAAGKLIAVLREDTNLTERIARVAHLVTRVAMRPAAPAEVVRLNAALARQAAPRAVASHSSTASAKTGAAGKLIAVLRTHSNLAERIAQVAHLVTRVAMRPAAPAEVVRLDAALARQAAPRSVASHSSTASAKT